MTNSVIQRALQRVNNDLTYGKHENLSPEIQELILNHGSQTTKEIWANRVKIPASILQRALIQETGPIREILLRQAPFASLKKLAKEGLIKDVISGLAENRNNFTPEQKYQVLHLLESSTGKKSFFKKTLSDYHWKLVKSGDDLRPGSDDRLDAFFAKTVDINLLLPIRHNTVRLSKLKPGPLTYEAVITRFKGLDPNQDSTARALWRAFQLFGKEDFKPLSKLAHRLIASAEKEAILYCYSGEGKPNKLSQDYLRKKNKENDLNEGESKLVDRKKALAKGQLKAEELVSNLLVNLKNGLVLQWLKEQKVSAEELTQVMRALGTLGSNGYSSVEPTLTREVIKAVTSLALDKREIGDALGKLNIRQRAEYIQKAACIAEVELFPAQAVIDSYPDVIELFEQAQQAENGKLEIFPTVLPSFQGTWKELIEALEQLS